MPPSVINWFKNATTGADDFGNAVMNMDKNAQTLQFGSFMSKEFWTAKSQMDLVSSTFDTLTQKATNYQWISADQLTQLQTDSATVVSTIQSMSGLIAVETAKYKADPNYNPSKAITAGVQEDLPNLQAALQGQVDAVKTSQDNQFNSLQTFLNNSKTIDDEHKAAALQAQATANQNSQTLVADNNAKILELYSSLGSQTQAERQSSMLQIQALESQNQQQIMSITNAGKDSILMTLQAQADQSGQITQKQKDQAIADADEQYRQSVDAAQKQYVESVAAINSMSDEAVAATGKTRDQLISDAKTQATETITQAGTMRDETVSSINDMATKADETDGKEININAKKNGFDDVFGAIEKIIGYASKPYTIVVDVVRSVTEKLTGGGKRKPVVV